MERMRFLRAIQALEAQTRTKIAALETDNAALRAELAALRRIVSAWIARGP